MPYSAPTHKVVLETSGFVRVDGRLIGFISKYEQPREASVWALIDNCWVIVGTFTNFRPYMTARAWAKFVFERKTPAQIVSALSKHNHKPIEWAKKLGFVPYAEVIAARFDGQINRKSRTGSTEK